MEEGNREIDIINKERERLSARYHEENPPEKFEEVVLEQHIDRGDYLKAKRKHKKTQIFFLRIKVIIRLLLIVCLSFVLYKIVKLPQWYLNDNIFKVYPNSSLELVGNEIIPTSKLLVKLNRIKIPHKPIYLIDTKNIEKALLELAPIQKVYIRRFWWPARLRIVIDEKEPIVSIAHNLDQSIVAFFTEDGTIIGHEYLPLNPKLKTYKVLTNENFFKWSPKHIKYIKTLAKAIEYYSGEEVQFIDLRNPSDVYIGVKSTRVRVGEFDVTLFKRIKRITSVLPQISQIKQPIDYIDLRWDNSTYIKLKGAPSTALPPINNQ